MQELHGTRRWLLGLLAAASATLGRGRGGRAADDGPYQRPDFDSREDFRNMCALYGGTFFADLSRIACYIPGYGWIDCDNDGQDCWVTPESGQTQPPGSSLPGDGHVVDGSPDQVAPGADPDETTPTENQKPRAKRGKGKQGKRHRHGRKGRS